MNNVEAISDQLIKAVNFIMDPCTPDVQRNEAHKMLDEFKDTSSSCIECGFFLSSTPHSSLIRHFGLQLIDHYIKLHWNSITCEEKFGIKNNVLQILSKDISFNEATHIKDALARIVVEMIKREWPQQWPSLLEELHNLCIMGDVQTELVLLIFLRLAEDIVQFQNIPDKRRREVYKGLCLYLKQLFPFFTKTLSDQCEKYFVHKNMQMQSKSMQNHCRVADLTLETLSVFFEWVAINYIAEESHLFKQLCHLLDDEILQIGAVKCLLSLVERKGKSEDRIPLLKLFEETELLKLRMQTSQTLEQYHLFLKFFSQTLVTLGTTLCYLIGQHESVKEPENFCMYLNCVLSLTRHPSMVVSHYTQNLWSSVLRERKLCQSASVISVIPNLLKCEAEKLFKVGFPSKPNSKASEYSLIEFDSDEDFEATFHKFRSDVCEVVKLITKQHPELAFNYGSSSLRYLFSGQSSMIIMHMEDSKCLDTLLIWDAVVHYFDAVGSTLMRNRHLYSVENLSKEGVELLQITINFNSEDFYVTSYALSCTSALFFFAHYCPDILIPIFRKIFSNLSSSAICDDKNSIPKDVLNLRRHSCSLLIKLCSTLPQLLLTTFDYLCQCVKDLMEAPDHLSALEKSALLEALMILSNDLRDYDRQLKFLNEMLSPAISIWLSDNMKLILSSPEHFMAFIGLNEPPDEINDAVIKNKAQLLLCSNVIKTCAKRCKIVNDPDIAAKGNFIHPMSQNLNTILYRNPSAQLLSPAFPGVFNLIRTIQSLHSPVFQAKMHPSYAGVTDISESDKNNILGIFTPNLDNYQQPKNPVERMKIYIQGIYDGCMHTLGDAAENLNVDFYMIPNLSDYLKDCLFLQLPYIPDYRLRVIIRTFLKPFFCRCPINLCGDLVNILIGFCNFMYQKLSTTWLKFKQRYGTSIGYEEQMTEIEEILEDQLTRLLTREYILFLGALLQSKPMKDSSENQMDDDSKQHSSNSGQPKQFSELGLKIFQTEAVRGAIVCTVFDGLHWLDTVTNIHCLSICELVFKQLLKDNVIQQIHEANYLFQSTLFGLQVLGEHECNLGLILGFSMQMYEKLRPNFPDLREALISSAACDLKAVEKMESVMFDQRAANEKQKKEAYKKAVQKIIGKNIGQYHKRDIVIKNLPPFFVMTKEENCDISKMPDDVGLCNLFNPSN